MTLSPREAVEEVIFLALWMGGILGGLYYLPTGLRKLDKIRQEAALESLSRPEVAITRKQNLEGHISLPVLGDTHFNLESQTKETLADVETRTVYIENEGRFVIKPNIPGSPSFSFPYSSTGTAIPISEEPLTTPPPAPTPATGTAAPPIVPPPAPYAPAPSAATAVQPFNPWPSRSKKISGKLINSYIREDSTGQNPPDHKFGSEEGNEIFAGMINEGAQIYHAARGKQLDYNRAVRKLAEEIDIFPPKGYISDPEIYAAKKVFDSQKTDPEELARKIDEALR